MNDNSKLFEPSLQTHVALPGHARERPWRLVSQGYVAFFGGALAVTAIAYFNGDRLGLSVGRRRLIILLGAATLLFTFVAIALILWLLGESFSENSRETGIRTRLVGRVIAVALFGALYKIQSPGDRLYRYRTSGEPSEIYGSLWGPGLLAVVGMGVIQFLLMGVLVAVAGAA